MNANALFKDRFPEFEDYLDRALKSCINKKKKEWAEAKRTKKNLFKAFFVLEKILASANKRWLQHFLVLADHNQIYCYRGKYYVGIPTRSGNYHYVRITRQGLVDESPPELMWGDKSTTSLLLAVKGLFDTENPRLQARLDDKNEIKTHISESIWHLLGILFDGKTIYYPGGGYDAKILKHTKTARMIIHDSIFKDKSKISEFYEYIGAEKKRVVLIPEEITTPELLGQQVENHSAEVLVIKCGALGSRGMVRALETLHGSIFKSKTHYVLNFEILSGVDLNSKNLFNAGYEPVLFSNDIQNKLDKLTDFEFGGKGRITVSHPNEGGNLSYPATNFPSIWIKKAEYCLDGDEANFEDNSE